MIRNTYREYGIVPMGRMTITPLKRMLERLIAEENTEIIIKDWIDYKNYQITQVHEKTVQAMLLNPTDEEKKSLDKLCPILSIGDLASKWGYIQIEKRIIMTVE